VYGRAESADKEIFGLGSHPRGFSHRHVFYKVGTLTVGYVHDLSVDRWGRLGVGVDITGYNMPSDLLVYYASSHSYHVFLRWRPQASAPHTH
jgi:hypothetical protein